MPNRSSCGNIRILCINSLFFGEVGFFGTPYQYGSFFKLMSRRLKVHRLLLFFFKKEKHRIAFSTIYSFIYSIIDFVLHAKVPLFLICIC